MGYPATPVRERFEAKYTPEPMSGCWLWTGRPDKYGYGRILVGRRTMKAHRVSFMLHIGEIPDGKLVCHKCDVRCCVNPEHLYAGTWHSNVHDAIRRGRYVAGGKPHPGEKNGRALLREADVFAIRRRVAAGETRAALSREFGISKGAIERAASGKSWRHLGAGLDL